MRPLFLAPSILSADFSDLKTAIRSAEEGGAEWIHVDVMDGHFVPNLTIGPPVVDSLRKVTKLPLDCHLMVSNPDSLIESFAKAGASLITIHAEASTHLHRSVQKIHSMKCKAGVAINPSTPLSAIEEIESFVDLILIMSVNPGFGGQSFIDAAVDKIKRLFQQREKKNLSYLIEVDGGVNEKNIALLYEAGVDVFVAGSAIFNSDTHGIAGAVQNLRKAATAGGK